MTDPSPTAADTVMLSLRVPVALKERLTAMSEQSGATIQSIGRRAIEIELATREEVLAQNAEREAVIRAGLRQSDHHPHR